MIPLGGNRNSVRTEFRQLGLGFYGGRCPHTGIEATMAQVNKLLMHFGCRSAVGLKIQISWEYLVVELGVTVQLLQVLFRKYWFLATDCWLKSLWEKVTEYGIHIEVDTVRLAPPQRGDT